MFGRSPDYDTNQDPVVRNTAGEVRKRLAQYYLEPGREAEIRIELPARGYVPEIYAPAPVPAATAPSRRRHLARYGIPLAILAAVAALYLVQRPSASPLDLFWAPLLRYPGPVVLCVGQGHTYKLRSELDRVFEAPSGPPSNGFVPYSEILPAWDRYVGLNDSQTVIRLAVLFTELGKDVTLRGGRSTTLEDLRGKPSVLIGAFNNNWTLNLTGELRFYFENEPDHGLDIVRDRQKPNDRTWQVRSAAADSQVQMDYAIVTRVFNSTIERPVVVAAGIRGAGTNAAGEFLTRSAYLAEALAKAPRDWASKNVQFVIATKLYSGEPGPPQVIAAYYW